MPGAPNPPRSAAWYAARLDRFATTSTDEILGALARGGSFAIEESQRAAWVQQIELLRPATVGVAGSIWLEFEVPRLGSRIDAVIVSGAAVVPIEFKVGARVHHRADYEQAWDYALDLKNFHAGSHAASILPILVATEAAASDRDFAPAAADGVHPPLRTNGSDLRAALAEAIRLGRGPALDADRWGREPYRPTPTIVQAARALYARHSVDAISRSDAGAKNLSVTSRTIEQIVQEARQQTFKAVVFVTGVPGAGKTLVGLDVATRHRRTITEDPTHAVYLSGNDPLVKVLREALTRDECDRLRREGKPERKGAVGQRVKLFIQNVHHFRDEGLRLRSAPPNDHVVVFDEAQRAWDLAKTARFMKLKKGLADFDMSEPEFQLAYMDRHVDWAVAICLVGGGQEIHDGEAGIQAWIDAVDERFPHWRIFVSTRLLDSEYGSGRAIAALRDRPFVHWHDDLHLSVSMRSFRAERVSGFVKAVLDQDVDAARALYRELAPRYPLVVTRDLQRAKDWIRQQTRGSERYGLVASSQAERLKPHAIDVRATIDPVHWFLDDRDDTRSSFYLEDAATEFQVQGLELDWVLVNWDADLRMAQGEWQHLKFHGSRWKQIRQPAQQRYLCNAYRVLLTRARQGMAVFVPPGEATDATRAPAFYDETFRYLVSLGVEQI